MPQKRRLELDIILIGLSVQFRAEKFSKMVNLKYLSESALIPAKLFCDSFSCCFI